MNGISIAQTVTQSDKKPLFWLEEMQNPDVNFRQLQQDFNNYWENFKGEKKSRGYKVFRRWEYINEPRVQDDGKLQAPGYVKKIYDEYSAMDVSAGGAWGIVGPTAYPTNNTGQPTGLGRVNAIGFHPTDANILYVGAASGGIWRSTNAGTSWTNLSSNIPTLGVSSILVHPTTTTTIYIGSGDRDAGDAFGLGVFKSTDDGATWVQMNNTMGNSTVGAMIMHPSNSDIILAATSSGIYKTTNGGSTWVKKSTVSGSYRDIKFNPGDPTIVYSTQGGKFYRSMDTGESWTEITSGITFGYRIVIGVTPANSAYVYLCQNQGNTYFQSILRSTDNGLNFTEVNTGPTPNIFGYYCDGSGTNSQANYDLCIAVDKTDEDILYLGSINTWKSTNGGTSWTIATHWVGSSYSEPCAPSVHADHHCLEWSPLSNTLYLGHDGGINYTADAGVTWPQITNNLAINQIYKIGQGASNVNYTLTGQQDNGSAATTDGSTFTTTRGGDGTECLIDYSNSNYCYNTYVYGEISRSTTGPTGGYSNVGKTGTNGIGVDDSGDWVLPYILHKTNASVMFAGYENVYRCDNIKVASASSVSWTAISTGETSQCKVLEQSAANPDIVYVYREGGTYRLKRTDNANAAAGSVAWSACNVPSASAITDIKTHPTDANIVYVTAGTQVYKSVDKGYNWTDITGNLPALYINCLVLDKNGSEAIYIGNQTGIWYKDATTAPNWVLFSNGLPPVDVRELEIYYDAAVPANNRIKAGTYGRGLWQSELMQVNVLDPVSYSANPLSDTQIDLVWTKNTAGNDVIIATSLSGTFGYPADGTSYSAGNTLPNGGGTVVYSGSLMAYSHTGLTTMTKYYYRIWSVDGANKYSAGLPVINATTLSHRWTGTVSTDWFTPGNWSTGSVPDQSNGVIIAAATFQPVISDIGAACGNLVIESGASLSMSGSSAYTLSVAGDFTNNGTFNRGIGTVDFNGSNALQTVKGSSTTNFYILKVNKGSQDNILEVTSLITLNAASNPLDITSGTFKLSSNSTITPFSSAPTIGSVAGLWNNGGTINSGNFNWTLNTGLIRVSAGIFNIGTSSGNSITYLNNGKLIIEGGALNIAGRFSPNSGTSSGTYTQSGGIITLNTVGSTATDRAPFEINSGVPFTMTGGTIIIQRTSSHTSAEYINNSSTNSVTGGTLQIGNSSTPASEAIYISGSCPIYNLIVNDANTPRLYVNTSSLVVKNNLTIAGGTLNANNNSFSVAGSWTNNGIFTPGTGTVTFNGTTAQTIGGSAATTFYGLTINGTDVRIGTSPVTALTSVSNALTINSGKKLSIPSGQRLSLSGNITNNAGVTGLVIEANASGSGSLLDPGTGISATVQRYIPANTVAYVCTPVSGATRNVFAGSVNNKLFQYNATTGAWEQITIDATPLEIMRGYAVKYAANTTLNFTGTLNTGTQSAGTASHVSLVNGGTYGWNLVGNAYPSAIDVLGSGWTFGSDIQGFVSYRKTDGNVAYFNKASATGSNGGTQYIPSTQAYWINLDGNSNIGLGTTNDSRLHQAQNIYKSIPNQLFRITASRKSFTDEATIGFYPEAINTHDAYDAEKMFINDTNFAMVYTVSPDLKNLAINGLSIPDGDLDIPLGFEALKAGPYRFTANPESLDPNTAVYLEDTQTGMLQDLRANPEYSFTSAAVNTVSRFLLHFNTTKINGKVVYDKPNSAPGLAGCVVQLLNTAGDEVSRDTTDSDGNFSFSAIPSNCSIQVTSSAPGGGWNSADALDVLRHFTSEIILDSLPLRAADANGNGYVNTVDALCIQKRFVGMINSFIPGEWVFESRSIPAGNPGTTHTIVLKGLHVGDVNKSWE